MSTGEGNKRRKSNLEIVKELSQLQLEQTPMEEPSFRFEKYKLLDGLPF